MKRTISCLVVCLTCALLLLSSCASTFEQAGKALEQGDYTKAIVKSLESIKKGKDVPAAEAMLKDAWQQANSEWNAQIATLEKSITASELTKAIPVYNKLLEIHEMVANAGRSDLKPTYDAIRAKASETQNRVTGMYFKEASATLALGGKENARKAAPQFLEVKKLDPKYPGIDSAIAQATKQATVKVFVVRGNDQGLMSQNIDMVPMVESLFSEKTYVEVVGPSNRPVVPMNDDRSAKNMAKEYKADVLVHLMTNTTYGTQVVQDWRRIDSQVTAVDSWDVVKNYVLTSATTVVNYRVTDLQTDKILDEGSISVKDSTDHGFSFTAVCHKGNTKNLQLGDMTYEQNLLLNPVVGGFTFSTLAAQFSAFESDLPSIGGGMMPFLSNSSQIDFNAYGTPEELATIGDLNGHVFFLFDYYESEPIPGGAKIYTRVYKADGAMASLEKARFDREKYLSLHGRLKTESFQATTNRAFLLDFFQNLVSKETAKKIYSFL